MPKTKSESRPGEFPAEDLRPVPVPMPLVRSTVERLTMGLLCLVLAAAFSIVWAGQGTTGLLGEDLVSIGLLRSDLGLQTALAAFLLLFVSCFVSDSTWGNALGFAGGAATFIAWKMLTRIRGDILAMFTSLPYLIGLYVLLFHFLSKLWKGIRKGTSGFEMQPTGGRHGFEVQPKGGSHSVAHPTSEAPRGS